MKDFLYRLAYKFQAFMSGRNGNDALGYFILSVYFLISLFSIGSENNAVGLIRLVLLLLYLFRFFSKKLSSRRNENQAFLRAVEPIRAWVVKKFRRLQKQKDYKYFKCPYCKTELRVPRGKGNITVTCPKCHKSFDKKS